MSTLSSVWFNTDLIEEDGDLDLIDKEEGGRDLGVVERDAD